MKHKHYLSNTGFTIIEVLIVLAIAGLILLIIFIAVPAMQRNARNVQRKHDAGLIASEIFEFKTNNGNVLPNALADNGNTNSLLIAVLGSPNTQQLTLNYYKTSGTLPPASPQYKDGAIYIGVLLPGEIIKPTFGVDNWPNVIDTESVYVKVGEDCKPTYNGHSIAVWYAVETGNGTGSVQCADAG